MEPYNFGRPPLCAIFTYECGLVIGCDRRGRVGDKGGGSSAMAVDDGESILFALMTA